MTFDGSQPCAQTDPEAWFPADSTMTSENFMAKRLCRTCSFEAECLELGMATPLPDGIWGGLTTNERRRLRRQRRRVA